MLEVRKLSEDQEAEVGRARQTGSFTLRPTVHAIDDMLYKKFAVLDHGFVSVIDYMGDDAAIAQAARVSYGRGTRRTSEAAGLIRYLMRHRHSTPFEMCEGKFHLKLPIFVARQWIRHRMANVNEYSARYSVLDREFYLPAPEHLTAQSSSNRQGGGDILGTEEASQVLAILRQDAATTYDHYSHMLNETDDNGNRPDPSRRGLSRELARINLNLGIYTQMYWKADLHNLLGFLALRADSHAQYEIRAYANVLLEIVKAWVPEAYAAFVEYRLDSFTLSAGMVEVVRRMVAGQAVDQASSGLRRRDWDDLQRVLQ